MSLQKTIAKNSLYNVLGSFSPILVIIITVPLYISQIGEARYGILALVWLILGYFGLFDLGLGKAVANQIAFVKEQVKSTQNEDGKVFWTAFIINLLLGIVGGLLLYSIGPGIISKIANGQDQLLIETVQSFAILSVVVPFVTISSVGTGFLTGEENFGIINILQVFNDVLFQVLPLLMAYYVDVSLYYLIAAAVMAKILSTVLLFTVIMIKKDIGSITFSKEKVKDLVSYGGAVTVTNIIGPILTSIDRFLIVTLAGAKAVTFYTIPYNLSVKINSITSSYGKALFPKFSMLSEKESKLLSINAVRLLITFITPIIIIGFLLFDPFLTIWISKDFSTSSSSVGYIILMGVWINNLAIIPFTLLQGLRRPGIVATIHSFELIPYLGILWILTSQWGVEGAAFAWSIRVFADAILMFIYADIYDLLWQPILSTSSIVIVCFLMIFYNITYHEYILIIIIIGFIIYGYTKYKTEYTKIFISIKSRMKL